mmetsp:Transcript_9788/g.13747  ORF Transcript_9788/g.13747 Transcript_9788/m.13747 type:complete len:176 (+) Transcript_9788:84-611(+)
MNILGAIGQGGMQVADMTWSMRCRKEDIEHRKLEIEWRKYDIWCRWVDEQWHAMDEKAKQLEQIANLSALLAGFALIGMCEVNIPSTISGILLIAFGTTTAIAVALPISSMLSSCMVLVAVIKFDPKSPPHGCSDFMQFWTLHCEADWRFSFRCFNLSIGTFLILLGQVWHCIVT